MNRKVLRALPIISGTGNASSIYDLVENFEYVLLQDTSDWNPAPKLMIDVAGGTTPDLVLRSTTSGENRIYIEVKLTAEISREAPFSQVVRHFLHLLAISRHTPVMGIKDMRRAVLLAAPSAWFERKVNMIKWQYFLDKYTDLATLPEVDITLGELRLDSFQ